MHYDGLTFVDVPIIQHNIKSGLGVVLSDIESRMPRGHQFSAPDLITWAHETTHGLNSRIRNANFKPGETKNAFYVLEGKAILLHEPKNIRLRQVAQRIPAQLRGKVYNLYLVRQAAHWDDRPLYVFDELSAYTNGSMARTDLRIINRSESVEYMWEMMVYGSYVAMLARNDEINLALRYLLNRASICYYSSSNIRPEVEEYISAIKNTTELIDFWKSLEYRILENI